MISEDEKVHKQALKIQELIDQGHLNEDDIFLLVNEGLDPKVAMYWFNNFKAVKTG